MGRWRLETNLYGERERWIPDFRGEWPADDAHLPGVMEGPLPEPCYVCGGELTRRTLHPDRARLEREQIGRARLTAALLAAGKEAPVFAPQAQPITQRIYDIACYRSAHGYGHPMAPRKSGPVAVGELVPASRTGDWNDR